MTVFRFAPFQRLPFARSLARGYQDVRDLFSSIKICKSHDMHHIDRVLWNALRAFEACPSPTAPQAREWVLWAALLHDVDDRKFFTSSSSNENARTILETHNVPRSDLVLDMIDAVSRTKNGDSVPHAFIEAGIVNWALIPRYADRLERVGFQGILRTVQYGTTIERPLFTDSTPRPRSENELFTIIQKERRWCPLHRSPARFSTVDFLIDDVLSTSTHVPIKNPFVRDAFRARNRVVVNYIIEFGRWGFIDLEELASVDQVLRLTPSHIDLENYYRSMDEVVKDEFEVSSVSLHI